MSIMVVCVDGMYSTLYTIAYTLTLLQADLVLKKSHVAYTTTSGGSLGLPVDEERSKLR